MRVWCGHEVYNTSLNSISIRRVAWFRSDVYFQLLVSLPPMPFGSSSGPARSQPNAESLKLTSPRAPNRNIRDRSPSSSSDGKAKVSFFNRLQPSISMPNSDRGRAVCPGQYSTVCVGSQSRGLSLLYLYLLATTLNTPIDSAAEFKN